MREYTRDDEMVPIPHPYTAEDIERGYTATYGEQGREVRRAIPIDVLRLIEARRLNAILTRAFTWEYSEHAKASLAAR